MATRNEPSQGAGVNRLPSWLRIGRPLRAVVAVGLVIILLIVGAAVLFVTELRSREVNSARRELITLNAVLAEEASRAFQSVDLVLTSLVEQFKSDNIATPEDYRRLKDGEDTHRLLKNKLSGLPQLDAITMIGADGKLINFSRFFPAPPFDLSNRDYVKALSQADGVEPFVSEPVENHGTGTWTIYLVRRVMARDGTLAGFVLGALDLRYFEDFYGSLELGRGSTISIWRRDGTLLARHPRGLRVGQRFTMPAFGEASPEDRTLVYEAAVAFDGEQRLISRRFVSGYPLVVVVSRTLRSVLGDWRSQSILTVITSTLAVLAVLVVMAALARQFSAYEALARAVRDREQAIAAREQAEAQLRQSQKLEAMGQLTSGVAHDFNNFLTVVIGNLELIARRLPSGDDPIRRLADGALAGAARAAGLTKRLLAFSRRQELAPQPVDVNELVEGMADILRHTLGRITLTLELAPGLPQIFADPNQLESALLNLVVNARDAMPDGGCVTVHTRAMPVAENEPAAIEVVVADAGTGMSEDVARQAFEPFFTTKPPGQGTGLGLAQVHDFVVQAEGEVKVDSVVGQGTRIHMRLPAWRAEGRVAART